MKGIMANPQHMKFTIDPFREYGDFLVIWGLLYCFVENEALILLDSKVENFDHSGVE